MARRSLKDCRIVLTGASSGIGRALARELAPQGVHLLLVARRQAELDSLAAELQQRGVGSAQPLAGDITDPDLRKTLLQRVQNDWQGLDLLVNNAGVSAHSRFADSNEQTLRRIMEVNFFAPAELTRGAIPLLRNGRDPLVVNVGSILGHRGVPYNSEYCASKFALRGWSEALRAELHREGIGVLLVSPGTTDTDFFEHLLAQEEATPWGKPQGVSPEQVAREMVRAVERRRREIFPNWRGRLLVTLNRFCPGFVDRVLNRYG